MATIKVVNRDMKAKTREEFEITVSTLSVVNNEFGRKDLVIESDDELLSVIRYGSTIKMSGNEATVLKVLEKGKYSLDWVQTKAEKAAAEAASKPKTTTRRRTSRRTYGTCQRCYSRPATDYVRGAGELCDSCYIDEA